jgi:hypothetical protein
MASNNSLIDYGNITSWQFSECGRYLFGVSMQWPSRIIQYDTWKFEVIRTIYNPFHGFLPGMTLALHEDDLYAVSKEDSIVLAVRLPFKSTAAYAIRAIAIGPYSLQNCEKVRLVWPRKTGEAYVVVAQGANYLRKDGHPGGNMQWPIALSVKEEDLGPWVGLEEIKEPKSKSELDAEEAKERAGKAEDEAGKAEKNTEEKKNEASKAEGDANQAEKEAVQIENWPGKGDVNTKEIIKAPKMDNDIQGKEQDAEGKNVEKKTTDDDHQIDQRNVANTNTTGLQTNDTLNPMSTNAKQIKDAGEKDLTRKHLAVSGVKLLDRDNSLEGKFSEEGKPANRKKQFNGEQSVIEEKPINKEKSVMGEKPAVEERPVVEERLVVEDSSANKDKNADNSTPSNPRGQKQASFCSISCLRSCFR